MDLIDRLRTYASTRKGELAELMTEAADALEIQTCEDAVSRQAAIKTLEKGLPSEPLKSKYTEGITVGFGLAITWIEQLPAVQPQTEWNNHTVACLLAELFGDACACNFNGIDEWLPEKCEVIDACPNPVGVACWEQFLKHRSRKEN